MTGEALGFISLIRLKFSQMVKRFFNLAQWWGGREVAQGTSPLPCVIHSTSQYLYRRLNLATDSKSRESVRLARSKVTVWLRAALTQLFCLENSPVHKSREAV